MKILYLAPPSLSDHDAARLGLRLSWLAANRGASPHVGFLPPPDREPAWPAGIHVHLLTEAWELGTLLSQCPFNLIVVVDWHRPYLLFEQTNPPVAIVHEMIANPDLETVLDLLSDPPMDALVIQSPYLHSMLAAHFNQRAPVPVCLVPPCVPTDTFRPGPAPAPAQRRIVLWSGSPECRGWLDFVTLADELARGRDDCEFWVIGGQSISNQAASRLLRRVDQTAALRYRFRWIQQFDYQRLPSLLALVSGSGGLVLATGEEDSLAPIVEALACGCPVMAPRQRDYEQVLGGQLAAGLHEPEAVQDAKAVFGRLLDDRRLRLDLAAAGRHLAEARYDINVVARAYAEFLAQCAGEATGSG